MTRQNLSPEDRQRAMDFLVALSTAVDADAAHEARMALLSSGLQMMADPIGVPCPAEDEPTVGTAGFGLTLGCPSERHPSGTRVHADGHAPFRLVSRMAHASRLALHNRATGGGAA